jgi:hypothetical protein
METHECLKENEWGGLQVERQLFRNHLEESDKQGGYRDRVKDLEDEVEKLKDARIWMLVVCLIGSFLGEVLPLKSILAKLFA